MGWQCHFKILVAPKIDIVKYSLYDHAKSVVDVLTVEWLYENKVATVQNSSASVEGKLVLHISSQIDLNIRYLGIVFLSVFSCGYLHLSFSLILIYLIWMSNTK